MYIHSRCILGCCFLAYVVIRTRFMQIGVRISLTWRSTQPHIREVLLAETRRPAARKENPTNPCPRPMHNVRTPPTLAFPLSKETSRKPSQQVEEKSKRGNPLTMSHLWHLTSNLQVLRKALWSPRRILSTTLTSRKLLGPRKQYSACDECHASDSVRSV